MPATKTTDTSSTSAEVTRTTKVPAAAKQPADHQPKATKPKPKVTNHADGFTVSYRGVTAEITPDALNDYELLEDAAAGEPTRLPSVLRRLVGDAKHDEVKEVCRNRETGRVLLDGPGSVAEWVSEVFEAINPS